MKVDRPARIPYAALWHRSGWRKSRPVGNTYSSGQLHKATYPLRSSGVAGWNGRSQLLRAMSIVNECDNPIWKCYILHGELHKGEPFLAELLVQTNDDDLTGTAATITIRICRLLWRVQLLAFVEFDVRRDPPKTHGLGEPWGWFKRLKNRTQWSRSNSDRKWTH